MPAVAKNTSDSEHAAGVLILIACVICFAPGCEMKGTEEQKKQGAPQGSQAMENPIPMASDIAMLQQEKDARNAAQQKLDSHIVLALKQSRHEPPFDKATALQPDLAIRPDLGFTPVQRIGSGCFTGDDPRDGRG